MGIGSILLLSMGIPIQGLPALGAVHWAMAGWLAVVNTAVAFTLWNYSLRSLPATESSVINDSMLVQIAVLARIALGERRTGQEIVGLALAGAGMLLVQLRTPRPAHTD